MIRLFRHTASLAAAVLLMLTAAPATAQIVSKIAAAQQGMDREWFAQIELDRARSRIYDVALHRGALFVLVDNGTVHSVDAETGRTNWVSQVGSPKHPSMGPAANDQVVALVNGSKLYVVDRNTGRMLWSRETIGGPGAGPALTETSCFVPMINGMVQAFDLEEPKKSTWNYFSNGRTLIRPRSSDDSVFWPTDKGLLYVSRAAPPEVRFRVEMKDEIASAPGYSKPYIYSASLDGYVVAVHELSGNQAWRFSTGDPIYKAPVAIKDEVFVCPDQGGMFCIDATTGKEKWWVPKASMFLAASPDRVYATDELARLFILDHKTGSRIATVPIPEMSLLFSNDQTDRLYLGSRTGVLQCLHDLGQDTPIEYIQRTGEDQPAEPIEQEGLEAAAPKEAAPAAGNPFGGAAPADDDPFGGAAPAPAPAPADDDPFGGGGDDPFN